MTGDWRSQVEDTDAGRPEPSFRVPVETLTAEFSKTIPVEVAVAFKAFCKGVIDVFAQLGSVVQPQAALHSTHIFLLRQTFFRGFHVSRGVCSDANARQRDSTVGA